MTLLGLFIKNFTIDSGVGSLDLYESNKKILVRHIVYTYGSIHLLIKIYYIPSFSFSISDFLRLSPLSFCLIE